jgi:hypothetical protein
MRIETAARTEGVIRRRQAQRQVMNMRAASTKSRCRSDSVSPRTIRAYEIHPLSARTRMRFPRPAPNAARSDLLEGGGGGHVLDAQAVEIFPEHAIEVEEHIGRTPGFVNHSGAIFTIADACPALLARSSRGTMLSAVHHPSEGDLPCRKDSSSF